MHLQTGIKAEKLNQQFVCSTRNQIGLVHMFSNLNHCGYSLLKEFILYLLIIILLKGNIWHFYCSKGIHYRYPRKKVCILGIHMFVFHLHTNLVYVVNAYLCMCMSVRLVFNFITKQDIRKQ